MNDQGHTQASGGGARKSRSQPADTPALESEAYWEARGRQGFVYRGDRFYTTTPIGFYYRRRARILQAVGDVLGTLGAGASVLDFGCGDGFYARHFGARFPGLLLHGCDISRTMIESAVEQSADGRPRVEFRHTGGPVPFDRRFDAIYIIAVLAHVRDGAALEDILSDLRAHLSAGGRLIVCEITSRRPRSGVTWARRDPAAYRDMLDRTGFRIVHEERIAFPCYNWIGRYLFHALVHLFFRGQAVRANSNSRYQHLTDRFMDLSARVDRVLRSGEGNTVYVCSDARMGSTGVAADEAATDGHPPSVRPQDSAAGELG